MTDNTPVVPEDFEFDLDAINSAISNAPDAGFVNQNFGRLTIMPMIAHWVNDGNGGRTKVSTPMIKGVQPDPKKGESLEIQIKVNIAEFNPALTFEYERNIPVRKSTDKDKSDWTEIVEPSLIKVLGKDWLKKAALRPYVCVEDVANVNHSVSKKSHKVLTVPKLIAVYPSAVECKVARDARYNAGAADGEDAGMVALNAVVDQVKDLIAAIGDMDEVAKILKDQQPYKAYETDQLLALALA